ncbi:MAG TPA: ATPase, T2SS/T4P/T4SS family [Acidimicrobiia bacterium]|jgi:pilus assembly protein CpaF
MTLLVDVKRAVQRRLLDDDPALVPTHDRARLRGLLESLVVDIEPLLDEDQRAAVVAELVDDVAGLGPIEPVLADPTVTELMLNGPGRAYIERAGRLVALPLELSADEIESVAQRVIAPLGLRLDRASPIVDARLPDGSRLHAVLPPLAPDGPIVTIRRFAPRAITLEEFGLDGDAARWLQERLAGGANVLVAGGTSAGKTTFLNALAGCIDHECRIVTIEETAELRLPQPHVVRLEARPANSEGAGATTVRDLVRASLRMRPDRIVVGEVRGGEALDLLQALNTGHAGSMCTIHANRCVDALRRLETLALLGGVNLPIAAVRAQIASAVDIVVFVVRGHDGRRAVIEIAEVAPFGERGGLRVAARFAREDRGSLAAVEAVAS